MESNEVDTEVRNIQTNTLFVDLRFPRGSTADKLRETARAAGSLAQLSPNALRLLARHTCFAGFSLVKMLADNQTSQIRTPIATRHHFVDWNFHPSFPRSRPNQWRIEMNDAGDSFKEWGVAKDDFGQAVYMERWQKLPGNEINHGFSMALRRCGSGGGILVVVGDHFAIAIDRRDKPLQPWPRPPSPATAGGGCAKLVDDAIRSGDRALAEQLLSIEGSCGRISKGWIIERSTHPWREGKRLKIEQGPGDKMCVEGEDFIVFECNFPPPKLSEILQSVTIQPESKL